MTEYMMARDWKSIALLSIGFSVGVAYTVACGDQKPMAAHADEGDSHSSRPDSGDDGGDDGGDGVTEGGEDTADSEDTSDTEETAPPGVTFKSRAVFEVVFAWVDGNLYSCGTTSTLSDAEQAEREAACCPEGFSFVGVSSAQYSNGGSMEGVCLEDA
jgi:hypothetical protein